MVDVCVTGSLTIGTGLTNAMTQSTAAADTIIGDGLKVGRTGDW
jgi:hypothetical protein